MIKNDHNLHYHIEEAKIFLYDKCDLNFSEFVREDEGQDYGACSFKLNELKIKFRISKITPTKAGQFVTIWNRNIEGATEPFSVTDEFDFVIISSRKEDNLGQFIFPKSALVSKGIIADSKGGGKRGIRVYPPWDTPINKQAEKTQLWQSEFFILIDDKTNLSLVKLLLENN